MTSVVGIDPSLNGTCLFDGTEYLSIKPKKLSGAERMAYIVDAFREFIDPDDVVFIEDFAFSRAQHAHDKGGLGWLLRMELYEQDIEVHLVLPNIRAMFATGKGNAAKPAVVSATSARTGIVFPDDDHCDAFLLWCIGKEFLDEDHTLGSLPKVHLRSMDKITLLE